MVDNNGFDNQPNDLNSHGNWDRDLIADVGSAPIESVNTAKTNPPTVTEEEVAGDTDEKLPDDANNVPEINNEPEPTTLSHTPGEVTSDTIEPSAEVTPVGTVSSDDTPTMPTEASQPDESIDTTNDFTPNNSPLPEPYTVGNETGKANEQVRAEDSPSETQTDTPQSVGKDVDDDFLNSLLQMSTEDSNDSETQAPILPNLPEEQSATPPVSEVKPLVVPEISTESEESIEDRAKLIERSAEPAPAEPTGPVEDVALPPSFPKSDQPINLSDQHETQAPVMPTTSKKPFPWFWLTVGLIVVVGVAVYFLIINRSDTYTSELPSANTSSSGTPTSTIPEVKTTTVSSDQQREDDLTAIQKGLEQYYLTTKKYPVSAEACKTSDEDCALKVLVSQYLSALPTDPTEPDRYYSYTSTEGKTYELSAIFDSLPSGITGVKISTGFVVTLTPGITFSDNITSTESSTITATTESTIE